MDIVTFRQQYPEFKDIEVFPDPMVQLWLDLAKNILPMDRWQDLYDMGVCLVTAHHLVLAVRDQKAADSGGTGGAFMGMVSSKSVDSVSVSYDFSAITMADIGHWGMTSYGVRLMTFARMVGAGGVQL